MDGDRPIERANRALAKNLASAVAGPDATYAQMGGVMRDLMPVLEEQLVRIWDDIKAFHEKFGLEYSGPPRLLFEDMSRFRVAFMQEELDEYKKSISGSDSVATRCDAFDALIDLVYVALGTCYLHGFPFPEGWRRVQQANMAKIRVDRPENSKRGSSFDVVKPLGWQPPDHTELVGLVVDDDPLEEQSDWINGTPVRFPF